MRAQELPVAGLEAPGARGLCERDAPADPADEVWATIRREGVEAAERDALMAQPITTALLRHGSFADGLAARLGRKLCDGISAPARSPP